MLLIACVPQRHVAVGNAEGPTGQHTQTPARDTSSPPEAVVSPSATVPRAQRATPVRLAAPPLTATPVVQARTESIPAALRPSPLQPQRSAASVVSPSQVLPLVAAPVVHAAVLPQAVDGALPGAWLWVLALLLVFALLLIHRTRSGGGRRAMPGPRVVARLHDAAVPVSPGAALPAPTASPAALQEAALQPATASPACDMQGERTAGAQLPGAATASATLPPAAPVQPCPLVFDAAVFRSWSLLHSDHEVWEYWMHQPPVDFGHGCALLPQPALAPVASAVDDGGQRHADSGQARSAQPGPVAVQADLPSGHADVSLQQQVQALLDEALGAGAMQVETMPGTELPQLPADATQLSDAALQALYSALSAVKQSPFADWMRAQLLLASGFAPLLGSAQQSRDTAMAMTQGEQRPTAVPTAAHWQALRLRLQLAWLHRSGTAACLLGLSTLRQEHAALSARAELPVLLAWRDVLLCWAGLQQGAAALARYAEAEAVCREVDALPGSALLGQQLLAETLLLRARHDRGGVRDETLRRADGIVQEALLRQPLPSLSLTAARIVLARAELRADAHAADLFEQALTHAMAAAVDPALQPAALQCRLAIQLAYEALAGGASVSPAAQGLAERLQSVGTLAAETWRRIVALQVRSGRFEHACQLAAQAARQQHPHADLLALWEQASSGWQAQQPQGAQRHAWQDNVRARLTASLS